MSTAASASSSDEGAVKGPLQRCADSFIFPCLSSIGIKTWEEAAKVATVTCFCFTANTILLLGRNIGATMLLTGLGADALPYVMILVGLFIMVIMPVIANLVTRFTSRTVLIGTTWAMLVVLSLFIFCFTTGVAEAYPRVVYPLFFVLEEVHIPFSCHVAQMRQGGECCAIYRGGSTAFNNLAMLSLPAHVRVSRHR